VKKNLPLEFLIIKKKRKRKLEKIIQKLETNKMDNDLQWEFANTLGEGKSKLRLN
jgi:hypothetical protein